MIERRDPEDRTHDSTSAIDDDEPLPPRFRLDPFADARLGRSLFEMRPEDWFEPLP